MNRKTFMTLNWRTGIVALSLLSSTVSFAESGNDELLNMLQQNPAATKAKASPETHLDLRSPLRKLVHQPTAEQNLFFELIEKSQWTQALSQWSVAFHGTAMEKSSNGRGLLYLLQFQNGLPLHATEALMQLNPADVNTELLQAWRMVATENHLIWQTLSPELLRRPWADFFGSHIEIKVRSRNAQSAFTLQEIKDTLVKTQAETPERAWLTWQLVHVQMDTDLGVAGKTLAILMKQKNNPLAPELMNITAARMLYEKGFIDAAIKYYQTVGMNSDYWFDAQEELAWSYLRKSEPQNTAAVTKTFLNPKFASLTGPEVFQLRAMAQLKICDYEGATETLKAYRDLMKPRVVGLLSLSEGKSQEILESVITDLKKGDMNWKKMGTRALSMPRFISRDRALSQFVRVEKERELEVLRGEELAQEKSGLSESATVKAFWSNFKNEIATQFSKDKQTVRHRVQNMAKEEIDEIKFILQRMHMIEVEVLTRSTLARNVPDRIKAETMKDLNGSVSRAPQSEADVLRFPAEKEIWYDELALYKVDVKEACHIKR